jgi:hypothetical protein
MKTEFARTMVQTSTEANAITLGQPHTLPPSPTVNIVSVWTN